MSAKFRDSDNDLLQNILRKYSANSEPSSSSVDKEIIKKPNSEKNIVAIELSDSDASDSDKEKEIKLVDFKNEKKSSDDEIYEGKKNKNSSEWSDDEVYLPLTEKLSKQQLYLQKTNEKSKKKNNALENTEVGKRRRKTSEANVNVKSNSNNVIDKFLAPSFDFDHNFDNNDDVFDNLSSQCTGSSQNSQKPKNKRKAAKEKEEIKAPKIRKLKPEEYNKFIKVEIDNLLSEKYEFKTLTEGVVELEASYVFKDNLVPNSVLWKRADEEYIKDCDGKAIFTPGNEESTEEALIIVDWQFVVNSIQEDAFIAFATEIKHKLISKRITLAIFGINYYLNKKENKKSSRRSRENKERKLTRMDLEIVLTELQVLLKWNSRLIDTPEELSMMIYNYTKAVAQIPYKQQKQERDNQLEKYLEGENKNCVQVDKNGNGLQRLWKQQLMSFPLSSLEIAEAIAAQYPSHKKLAEAYKGEEGEELLLQNVPIRRGAGPFSNARNLGPELSKKIHRYFTSTNAKDIL